MKYRIFCTSGDTPPTDKAYQTKVGEYQPWFIDINSLEDMQALITTNAPLVVRDSSIEIYDDYME